MPDIIQLLPDHIANQIAAGEVIQRPASAVKEMMENAIDAGATQVHLILRDAGKELIQVIDDGKGMSPTDARISFERHATSKINSIDDLFAIRTMGFRGEALASIAAVAQVELKTRRKEDEVGTLLQLDHSVVRKQEPCQTPVGTNLAIKNLFFNVPARRNFLKSNTTEMRHIVDEFTRIALAFPEIRFRLTHNDADLFNLEKGKLKQRVMGLLGQNLQAKLVPVEEPTDVISIQGFIAAPDMASKTRGNQYFFVNQRFIRSPYLNHAVTQAYKELIAKDEFPLFVLFIEIEPHRVDINVHPTKQEIKFEDDRIVYSFVNAAVKHALSKYSIAPSLDFNLDQDITRLQAVTQPFTETRRQETREDYLYQSFSEKGRAHFLEKKEDIRNWKELYKVQQAFTTEGPTAVPTPVLAEAPQDTLTPDETFQSAYLQLAGAFVLVTTRSGALLFDQHLAHQRILYDRMAKSQETRIATVQVLHPQTLQLSPSDTVVMESLLPDLQQMGYAVEVFGPQTFIIQGIPADLKPGEEKHALEALLEAWKHHNTEGKIAQRERLWRTLSQQRAVPAGKKLSTAEMEELFLQLFQCEQPGFAPNGKPIFTKLNAERLRSLLLHG